MRHLFGTILGAKNRLQSTILLLCVMTLVACTEGKAPLVCVGKGSQGNGAGYTGIINPLGVSRLSVLGDFLENAATVVRNFGANILNNEAIFEGDKFVSYWGGEAYMTVDSIADLNLKKEDFTIGATVKFKEVGLYNAILARWDNPIRQWVIILSELPDYKADGKLYWQFGWSTDGKNSRMLACEAKDPKKGSYELRATRNHNRLSFWVNNTLCAAAITEDVVVDSTSQLDIGRDPHYQVPQFIGSIKDINIIKGASYLPRHASYTANYTGLFCKDGLTEKHCTSDFPILTEGQNLLTTQASLLK